MYSLWPKPQLKGVTLQKLLNSRSVVENLPCDSARQISEESVVNDPCAFDSSLLLLSGYRWEQIHHKVVPNYTPDFDLEEFKMQKQVRFCYDNSGLPLKTHEETFSSPLIERPKTDELNYGFVNTGDLLIALNDIRSDEFNFVSLLQIDESMEKHLSDILCSFPITSSLYIFITPRLSATSVAKYVINMSRKASTLPDGEEVFIVLRDRSTDKAELCSSVTKALSIISSFEGEVCSNYLARVFELSMFLGDETVSFSRLESMIFDMEREVSKQIPSDLDCSNDTMSSSSSSSFEIEGLGNDSDISDFNGNLLSKDCSGEIASSDCSQLESLSRNTMNSSFFEYAKTNFFINLDDMFVKTLTKLMRINQHTIVYIQSKDQDEVISDEDRDNTFTIANGTHKSETSKIFLSVSDKAVQRKMSSSNGKQVEYLCSMPVYMMSIKEYRSPQIFLYCKSKSSAMISELESVEEIYKKLTELQPAIHQTHEAYVTKFDDENDSFEKLLYSFIQHNVHSPEEKKNLMNTNAEEDNHTTQINGKCLNNAVKEMGNGQNGFSDDVTPCMNAEIKFNIPDIVITPPVPCDSRKHLQKMQNILNTASDGNSSIVRNDSLELGFNTSSAQQFGFGNVSQKISGNSQQREEERFQLLLSIPNNLIAQRDDSRSQCENKEDNFATTTPDYISSASVHKVGNECSGNTIFDASAASQTEDNSDKENTTTIKFDEALIEALKRPKIESTEFMAKFKVSSAIIVHLTDRISSIQEQKGRAAGNLLVYLAREVKDETEIRTAYLGIILFDDTNLHHSRFSVPSEMKDINLETALNYLLAWYIIRILARVERNNTSSTKTLIQSPIQRDSAAIMIMSGHLGCDKVIACSNVEEIKKDLLKIVPRCLLLDGHVNKINLSPMVGKKGADVIIMLRQQELCEHLELLAPSGRLVICGDIDRTKEIDLSTVARNSNIHVFDALTAVRYIASLQDRQQKEFEEDFYSLLMNEGSELNECFPTAREGYFYQIIGHVSTSCLEEQMRERAVCDIFFSTVATIEQMIQSAPTREKKMLRDVYDWMTFGPATPALCVDSGKGP